MCVCVVVAAAAAAGVIVVVVVCCRCFNILCIWILRGDSSQPARRRRETIVRLDDELMLNVLRCQLTY